VLEKIQQAGGQQYIFTHHRYLSLKRLLDAFGLGGFFAEIVTPESGFPRKPDPAGFRYLVEKYAMPAGDVLAVGDREPDILSAQAAGIRACLFGPQPLDDLKPDYFISSYDQLESIMFSNTDHTGASS